MPIRARRINQQSIQAKTERDKEHILLVVLLFQHLLSHVASLIGTLEGSQSSAPEEAAVCRYASDEGMAEAAQYAGLQGEDVYNKQFQARARAKLYSPGQPMALELAKNPTALVVNNTLFAHGGVLPEHGKFLCNNLCQNLSSKLTTLFLPDFRLTFGDDQAKCLRASMYLNFEAL